eukprot:2537236-Prymnesium_polylepis.1
MGGTPSPPYCTGSMQLKLKGYKTAVRYCIIRDKRARRQKNDGAPPPYPRAALRPSARTAHARRAPSAPRRARPRPCPYPPKHRPPRPHCIFLHSHLP